MPKKSTKKINSNMNKKSKIKLDSKKKQKSKLKTNIKISVQHTKKFKKSHIKKSH